MRAFCASKKRVDRMQVGGECASRPSTLWLESGVERLAIWTMDAHVWVEDKAIIDCVLGWFGRIQMAISRLVLLVKVKRLGLTFFFLPELLVDLTCVLSIKPYLYV